jgi:hypothetical protein
MPTCSPFFRFHQPVKRVIWDEAWGQLLHVLALVVNLHAHLNVLENVQIPASAPMPASQPSIPIRSSMPRPRRASVPPSSCGHNGLMSAGPRRSNMQCCRTARFVPLVLAMQERVRPRRIREAHAPCLQLLQGGPQRLQLLRVELGKPRRKALYALKGLLVRVHTVPCISHAGRPRTGA